MNEPILYILVIWNIALSVFFLWQTQKLVNKVMSKDFAEYQRVQTGSVVPKREEKYVFEDDGFLPPPADLGF